tara:strand:+ start:279 stop:545 length:267 start_codon:yes stop_codon:yes gene_type:complete
VLEKTLTIDIPDGTWKVDIVKDKNDSGIFDLIHPQKSSDVTLEENRMYGFEYSVSAKPGTPFTITLGDKVLVEDKVDDSKLARGSGVL